MVGATGLVGRKMLQVLAERNFPVRELIPVASERSVGQEVHFQGGTARIVGLADAVEAAPDVALFSAGGSVSLEWAPRFAAAGTTVIDNSSAWRMHPEVPLVVPEVNGAAIGAHNRIIANPNCTTAQLVMVLKPLHDAFGVVRGTVSTYQSVTGTGAAAIAQHCTTLTSLTIRENNNIGEKAAAAIAQRLQSLTKCEIEGTTYR